MSRFAWLTVFALSMALTEAAIVIHLRHLYYPADPQSLFPLHVFTTDDLALEFVRELATLTMIGIVALLAERRGSRRFAAFVFVFGWWDLGYYAWLKIFLDWPRSWLEWDVLFLIPWPWFGPWLAPALIALMFVIWSGAILLDVFEPHWTHQRILLFAAGAALALQAFLAPAWSLLPGGESSFRDYVPVEFSWPGYWTGLAAMTTGLILATRRARTRNGMS